MWIFVGIDPGRTGMLAIISVHVDKPDQVGLHKLGDNPAAVVRDTVGRLVAAGYRVSVVLEKTFAFAGPKAKMGPAASHSLGKSEGQVLGALTALNVPFESVRPQDWKGLVLKGTDKSKEAAVEFVTRRYPGAKILLPKGKPNHDAAEAVCMAEYARRVSA